MTEEIVIESTVPNDTVITFNTKEEAKVLPAKSYLPTFTLVPENHPILSEVMPEFDFANPPVDPNAFASSLVETCRQNNGLGLSANQCGFKYRVFVMGAEDNYVAFFNPKIVNTSKDVVHMAEGCLSFPQLFLHITRPSSIEVTYQDYNGEHKKAIFTGMSARCFLHELDHMDGIVYTKKAKPLALQMSLKKRNKLMERYRRANERLATRVRPGLSKRR